LLGGIATTGSRFVILRCGSRRVALIVDAVLDVRTIEPRVLAALPPLLGGSTELAVAIGTLDAELVVVLDASRLLPVETWNALEASA
jgi:chemotaxis signal transduction protein